MKINYLIFITTFFFGFISCNKEKDTKSYVFSGITETDELGQIVCNIDSTNEVNDTVCNIDTTDWRFDDIFSAEEMALFDNLLKNQQEINILKSIGKNWNQILFYPNPTEITGYLHFGDNTVTSFVMVDNKFNKLLSISENEYQDFQLNFEGFNNGIYRIYYIIQNQNREIIGKGHGDIMKK